MSTEQKGWLSVNLVQLNQYCNTDPRAEAASPFLITPTYCMLQCIV